MKAPKRNKLLRLLRKVGLLCRKEKPYSPKVKVQTTIEPDERVGYTEVFQNIDKELRPWIRSKVAIFFGQNHKFMFMCLVDSEEQAKYINRYLIKFPCYYEIHDDIPRVENIVTAEGKDIRINAMGVTVSNKSNNARQDFNKLFVNI